MSLSSVYHKENSTVTENLKFIKVKSCNKEQSSFLFRAAS